MGSKPSSVKQSPKLTDTQKKTLDPLMTLAHKERLWFTDQQTSFPFLSAITSIFVSEKIVYVDISSIPDDVLLEIISFLPEHDLSTLQCVNKEISQLIKGHDELIWSSRLACINGNFHGVPDRPKHVSPRKWHRLCLRSLFRFYPPLCEHSFVYDNQHSLIKHGAKDNGDCVAVTTPPMVYGYYYLKIHLLQVVKQSNNICVGITKTDNFKKTGYLGSNTDGIGWFCMCNHVFQGNGKIMEDYQMGDVLGILVDMDECFISFFKNDKFFYKCGVFRSTDRVRMALSTLYSGDTYQLIYDPYPHFDDTNEYLAKVNKWYEDFAN